MVDCEDLPWLFLISSSVKIDDHMSTSCGQATTPPPFSDWHPVKYHIHREVLLCLVYKSLHGLAPSDQHNLLHPYTYSITTLPNVRLLFSPPCTTGDGAFIAAEAGIALGMRRHPSVASFSFTRKYSPVKPGCSWYLGLCACVSYSDVLHVLLGKL